MHAGGFSYWEDAPVPAPEPEHPVTIDDVIALARKMPSNDVSQDLAVGVLDGVKLTAPRRMVLAQATPGTIDFVHAGERFEIGPGGYVVCTPEAADAADFPIVGHVIPATA